MANNDSLSWSLADTELLIKLLLIDKLRPAEIYDSYAFGKSREALLSKCRRILAKHKEENLTISAPKTPIEKPEDLWQHVESKNKKYVAEAENRDTFTAVFKTERPIGISFISDQHISPNTPCDLHRMRVDAEYVAQTDGLYACLMGDGVDNHIKHRAAVINAKTSPAEQYKLYDYYLSLFKDKIVVMCSGNHDLWTEDMAGVDLVKHLADANKIHYSKHQAIINMTVGEIPYKLAFRHQYKMGSTLNQTHAVKQWLRLGDDEFDIGAIGHHHESAIESFIYRGIERWVCRPGSYQLTSGFTNKYGFNVSVPTCPTFILYPKTREIVGFSNLYKAGAFLTYERSLHKR